MNVEIVNKTRLVWVSVLQHEQEDVLISDTWWLREAAVKLQWRTFCGIVICACMLTFMSHCIQYVIYSIVICLVIFLFCSCGIIYMFLRIKKLIKFKIFNLIYVKFGQIMFIFNYLFYKFESYFNFIVLKKHVLFMNQINNLLNCYFQPVLCLSYVQLCLLDLYCCYGLRPALAKWHANNKSSVKTMSEE